MKNEISLWKPRTSVLIPVDAQTPEDIASYSKQLTNKELKQVIAAFNSGGYEMGSLFLWQKTMTGLKKQLGSLGMDFIGELLDRSDITGASSPSQVLTDFDAVRLAEELGMFSPTQAMRLRNVLQMVVHFSESPAEDEEDGERQMMPEEAIQCLRTCIQSVLGHEKVEGAIEFAQFRKDLEEKTFSTEDTEIQILLESPYFFQRTTLRVLLALAKTSEGAQLQHTLNNAIIIIPCLWPMLLKPDRWMVGRAYAEVHSEGRKTAAAGLRKALLKVQGFDYVPEDLRFRIFLRAASDLQNTHFSMNNFYNEPSAINNLASLGTIIPPPALSRCITAILCVRLGNNYGRSFAAQPKANELLSKLGNDRWRYYLGECLPADDVILEKLTFPNIIERWNQLVADYQLHSMNTKQKEVAKLLASSAEKKTGQVAIFAMGMLNRLTSTDAKRK